jgi:hypothetical protein
VCHHTIVVETSAVFDRVGLIVSRRANRSRDLRNVMVTTMTEDGAYCRG